MKKVSNIIAGISIAILIWVFLSWVEVAIKNLPGIPISALNFFQVLWG